MCFATSRIAGKVSLLVVTAMLLSVMAPVHVVYATTSAPVSISSFTNAAGDIHINAGRGEGVKAGSKGVILRGEKKIAEYEVVSVNWGFSQIKVSDLESGYTVQAGDSAPITDVPESQKKRTAFNSRTILTVAGVLAGALLLSSIRGKSSGGTSGGNTISLSATGTGTSVTITATIRDAEGFSVPNGTMVSFMTTAGILDRTQATTSAGRATVTLTKDPTDDTESATVTASYDGRTSSITVSFISTIELVAEPTTIMVESVGGTETTSTITATCRDVFGNPASSGEVTFTSSIGDIAETAEIGPNGVATVTFSSGVVGKANINASWSNSTANVQVTVTAGPPLSISVNSSKTSLECDGISSLTITATVHDVKGNPVVNGTIVHFSVIPDANGGGNGTITAQAATSNGNAVATLFSRDATNAPSKSGTATIKVEVRKAGQPSTVPAPAADLTNTSRTIQFISRDVGEIRLSAKPVNIRGWDEVGNQTTLKAVVFNADRQPVPDGTTVHFSSPHGLIPGGSSTTSGGIANITLVTDASGSSGWNGLVDVTAKSGSVSFTANGLVIFSGPPSPTRSTAELSQNTLPTLGGQATIIVTALDVNGNPVTDDTRVTAITDKGTIASGEAGTSGGNVAFTLRTSTNNESPTPEGPGTVRVSIDSGGKNAETGGQPVVINLPFTVVP